MPFGSDFRLLLSESERLRQAAIRRSQEARRIRASATSMREESRALIAQVSEPTDIKVFVTPTCPHCPRAVTLAHKMAMANPLITATCVEATEFMDLSRQFRVTGVPKTVVNGTIEIMGALPEAEFVRAVLNQAPESLAPPSA